MIDNFRGQHRWLSNFAFGGVNVYGYQFQNREAAFQAMKCEDKQDIIQFLNMSAKEAKAAGQKVRLRADWEKIKDEVMYTVCKAYFTQCPEEKQKLLSTGKEMLVEGNNWHDNHWGICRCEKCGDRGENMLGKILMRIRDELK